MSYEYCPGYMDTAGISTDKPVPLECLNGFVTGMRFSKVRILPQKDGKQIQNARAHTDRFDSWCAASEAINEAAAAAGMAEYWFSRVDFCMDVPKGAEDAGKLAKIFDLMIQSTAARNRVSVRNTTRTYDSTGEIRKGASVKTNRWETTWYNKSVQAPQESIHNRLEFRYSPGQRIEPARLEQLFLSRLKTCADMEMGIEAYTEALKQEWSQRPDNLRKPRFFEGFLWDNRERLYTLEQIKELYGGDWQKYDCDWRKSRTPKKDALAFVARAEQTAADERLVLITEQEFNGWIDRTEQAMKDYWRPIRKLM